MSNDPIYVKAQTPQHVRGDNLAVYIHWPFCKSKCPYCDFNSHVRDTVEQDRWKSALLKELDYMASHVKDHTVTSIFFGGGTPSLMPPGTAQALIDRVHALWPVAHNMEITLEANPTSVETDTFKDFKAAGINRVSLGVQSFRDEELKFLGRGHSVKEALKAIDSARSIFERYSFDLIYARPNQTVADWEKELYQALHYIDSHMSLYQLTIEENTAFHHAYKNGGFTLPDEETSERLYRLTEEMMADRGLTAYEVSNYAKPNQESRHNMSYWQGDDYIGAGPGAHGRLTISRSRCEPAGSRMEHSSGLARSADRDIATRIATATLKSPERWLSQVEQAGHATDIWHEIDREQEIEERVMMGLRIKNGICYEDFGQRHGYDLRDHIDLSRRDFYIRQGLLENDANALRTTLNGRLLLNRLTAELLA